MDEAYIRRSEITGLITVTGYGECRAEFQGRTSVADVEIGDYVGLLMWGGMAHHVVRIGDIKRGKDETTFILDWNGVRETSPGGSLLAEHITVPPGDRCKEIWRPVADAVGEVTL